MNNEQSKIECMKCSESSKENIIGTKMEKGCNHGKWYTSFTFIVSILSIIKLASVLFFLIGTGLNRNNKWYDREMSEMSNILKVLRYFQYLCSKFAYKSIF